MEKDIVISELYLKQLVDYFSTCLVGKICKRFEILEDRDVLKKEVRELVYEHTREFGRLLSAYKMGRELTEYKFKSNPPTK